MLGAKANAELVAAPTFLLRAATSEALLNLYPQAGGMTERSDGGPAAALGALDH